MTTTLTIGPWDSDVGLYEVTDFAAVNVSYNMDAGDEISWTMRASAIAATGLQELAWDAWLYDDDALVQRFRIILVGANWGPDGQAELGVQAVSYKRLFNWRLLQADQSFSQVGQADIVWALIDHTQQQLAGDLGITPGLLDSAGRLRDRNWVRGENIGKLLDDLSGVIDGPYWTVDGDRKLIVKTHHDFDTHSTPIIMGVTARAMTRKGGVQQFANGWFVSGDNELTVPEMALHPDLATDPRGRWEQAAGYPSVTVQETLVEKAAGLVTESQSPIAQWSVELDPHRYENDLPLKVGDFAVLVWPAAMFRPVGAMGSIPVQVLNLQSVLTADAALSVSVELIELAAP